MQIERAGVLIVRAGQVALIERERDGRRYWVIPGGGVENGETVAAAALREAEEELGVAVTLGQLCVRIDYRENDGSFQRQWYFDASVDTADIVFNGQEATSGAGTYRAVWRDLEHVDIAATIPAPVAQFVTTHSGSWPAHPTLIDQRPQA